MPCDLVVGPSFNSVMKTRYINHSPEKGKNQSREQHNLVTWSPKNNCVGIYGSLPHLAPVNSDFLGKKKQEKE